jgi:hypothetical protein
LNGQCGRQVFEPKQVFTGPNVDRALGLRALVSGFSKIAGRSHMKEDESMKLSMTRATHDTVMPATIRECFPSRPAMTTSPRSATMTTQRLYATVALGLFLGGVFCISGYRPDCCKNML